MIRPFEKRDVLWYGAVCPSVCKLFPIVAYNSYIFLSDFDQTWYVYLLGHATPDVGLIIKFDPRGTREGRLKGKLGQISQRYIFFVY